MPHHAACRPRPAPAGARRLGRRAAPPAPPAAAVAEPPPRGSPETASAPPALVAAPEDLALGPGELSAVKRPAQRVDLSAYLRAILTSRVYDVAARSAAAAAAVQRKRAEWSVRSQVVTPLDKAVRLSERLGSTVLLKREDMQPVFSFKLRGAYNAIAGLPADVLRAGVVTASAGNHAQGVALSAQRLGVSAVVCMPTTTPGIKVAAVRRMGAEVRLVGDTFDATAAHARSLATTSGRAYVPPFDSPAVIAGQGSVGVELLRQVGTSPLHAVFVPVGGGGLLAGVGAYIKSLRPDVLVIGVEPEGACGMAHSLREGAVVTLTRVDGFADGVAVKTVGSECLRLASEVCDGVVTVGTGAICAAIKDVFEDTRSILEPAGALALAGAKAYLAARPGLAGCTVAAVASGANLNFDRLRLVAELADVGLRTEAVLATRIPEQPGAFKRFAAAVSCAGLDITEFKYRTRGGGGGDSGGGGGTAASRRPALVLFSVALRDESERGALLARLAAQGFESDDLSNNPLALMHARHLAGGLPSSASASASSSSSSSPPPPPERLLALSFPEKPGALAAFLDAVSPAWDISLFHYRSQGATVAAVLCGLRVPTAERGACDARLDALGYDWRDETHNPAWRLFD